jgi:hypothetical protein
VLRNPRACGVGGSRPHRRYSFRHSHSPPLHHRSPCSFAGDGDAPLPSRLHSKRSRGLGTRLEPRWILGAGAPRPVSYYALFQGWLLLSQPPGCPRAPTTFPTEPGFRDLSRRSGLCPSRRRIFAPAASLPRREPGGIRGLCRVGRREAPASKQRPTPARSPGRLHLNAFRGEPAISGFAWHFTPTHSSSEPFATDTGSVVHRLLQRLPPGHG